MWELIEANKRRSWIIFICMGFFLILLGYFIGRVWMPPNGGLAGIIIALCMWIILSIISFSAGSSILLGMSRAKEVSYDVHPQLFNIVEEMKIAASLPAMPKIYIIDEPAPNAFATGRNPETSAIAVTAGLLSRLNRDELQGVVAHEMSHIVNRDVLYLTFAGIMLGSIVMLSEVFLRSMWFGGSSRRYRSSRSSGGGQGQAVIMIVAIVLAILAPIIARIFYFALSRKREYLADASAVRLTRYPEGLASALDKISSSSIKLPVANKITTPMYIASPLRRKDGRALVGLFSTHPPIKERVGILRSMGHGVNYEQYQKAYASIKGESASIIPPSALKDRTSVSVRKTSAEVTKPASARTKTRDLGDLMRAVNKYMFLMCVCGLKIKVPPNFKKNKLSCPRCKKEVAVPLADVKVAAAVLGTAMAQKKAAENTPQPVAKEQQAVYARKGAGWESFPCTCGTLMLLSPLYSLDKMKCKKCGRTTAIRNK